MIRHFDRRAVDILGSHYVADEQPQASSFRRFEKIGEHDSHDPHNPEGGYVAR